MSLLVILPHSANDSIQAERLCDLIAAQNKRPAGHCLLVAAPDTHGESQTKVKIAAELAFASVELLVVDWPKVAPTCKAESVNHLFYEAATHAARSCQWPFIWLEPDAVPLRREWLDDLDMAYHAQPKRYFGPILASADGKQQCMARVAVYPRGAGGELKEFFAGKVPFEQAGAKIILSRAGKTRLIQQMAFGAESDRNAVRDDAVLLHSDKEGVLLSSLLEGSPLKISIEGNGDDKPQAQRIVKRRGRPSRLAIEPTAE